MELPKANAGTEELQAKAKLLFRETEAIRTLVHLIKEDDKPHLARTRECLDACDRKTLETFIQRTEKDIEGLRKHYGIKVSNSELMEVVDWARNQRGNFLPLFPKHVWRQMFDNYERVMPDFAQLPEHADIAIPISNQAGPGKVAFYLLEAILYEDMASTFNLAKEHQIRIDQEDPLKAHKMLGALCRGTVAAAFYFVESYLNGIAFDYYMLHESSLGQQAKGTLLEWDFGKNRAKHLSLRDKILQYPKLILGKTDPPLQESNCPEMAFIIEKSKILRDAIVHAAPRLKSDFPTSPDKRQQVYLIGFNDAEATMDNAVGLVRKIETAIHGNDRRLSWLYERTPDSFFPDAAFE